MNTNKTTGKRARNGTSSDCIFTNHLPQQAKPTDVGISPDKDNIYASSWTSKCTHVNKEYFDIYTIELLKAFYPKQCPECEGKEVKPIKNRPTEVYCPKCRSHYSLTSNTPLDKFRLPLWTFGYVMKEAIDLYPQPLTITCIKTKLKVGTKTATLLKRRLQVFLSDMIPAVEKMMADTIRSEFPEDYTLPDKDTDVTAIVKNKPVIYSDTIALFSASQRANGGRSRYKHNGQTSSIYLTDAVAEERGKYQIGTLVHTISLNSSFVIFKSIPDQRQKTIVPLLDFLPKNAPHFSDEGFPYLHRLNSNYRAINHSARAKDGQRNVYARDRWSKNGVHSQVAEGFQRALKTTMANYCYVKPEYSQLYLDEWCAIRALKQYGIQAVADAKRADFGVSSKGILNFPKRKTKSHGYIQSAISAKKYIAPMPDDRNHANFSKTRKQIPQQLRQMLDFNEYFDLKQAVWDYLYFWDESDGSRRKNEIEFNSYARRLYGLLKREVYNDLGSLVRTLSLPRYHCLRIARIWHKLKIANVVYEQRKGGTSVDFKIKPLIPVLPDILYTYDKEDLANLYYISDSISKQEPQKKPRLPKYGMSKDKRKQIIKEKGYEG